MEWRMGAEGECALIGGGRLRTLWLRARTTRRCDRAQARGGCHTEYTGVMKHDEHDQ